MLDFMVNSFYFMAGTIFLGAAALVICSVAVGIRDALKKRGGR